ncbi:uncharacterized protein CcaverHIS019_0201130 [Cutaneotrichosporon cavernicola]|uniref:Presequence translocated-associated motor subunit PAM17 n=1 Tax=Cutaneotrichosporon cavernicola TaxID=279322 RepID=A0AA48I0A1_9TREE|nr:uncharacterized protein CcaverHIS019_0201130 [Cutaneotrichosporon cavernicola]BEI88751.1 hypothetical protein CcaverHIS019_0201130 [Cutaneotrichosporon cavernicola]BEI96526.1 hypothetical protein CcaverHIS631_0201150 [Cutaneotrichosporon cavernicola]BEJ04298.1 hypothetical protein CcaverHIS641_0201150 [Cutaneotrichosporon cavernicola]
MSLRQSVTLARARPITFAAPVAARFASSSSSSAAQEPESNGKLPMTWSEYLAMRKRRKQWSTLTTIPTTIGGLMTGASYAAQHSMTAEGATILGFDPMIVYGAGTVGAMALGYLVGPAIGNTVFSVTHPKLSKGNPSPLEVMDREFFNRIKERRADPSRQSVNNPAPDYYGEKIVSLQAYRRWLKDQKAYERKTSHGVPDDA